MKATTGRPGLEQDRLSHSGHFWWDAGEQPALPTRALHGTAGQSGDWAVKAQLKSAMKH